MANQFVSIPVPAANGSGAAVDVSSFGALKTAVFNLGTANDDLIVTLEFSNDAGAVSWQPLVSEQGGGGQVFEGAHRWIRATVTNYKRGTPADVQLGGTDDGADFATLVVPVADGVGAAVDISAMAMFQTVQCGGTFRGNVGVELSEDGVTWGEFYSFNNPGKGQQNVIAQFARATRSGVPQIAAGAATINIGATSPPGGSPFGAGMAFRYTVTGAEPDLTDFMIPLPDTRLTDDYIVIGTLAGVAEIIPFDLPDLLAGDRTTTQFRFVAAAPMTAGDQIDFTVFDPVP